jgi:ornithine cyclodeaminase
MPRAWWRASAWSNACAASQALEADFGRWHDFDKTARTAAHSAQGVIELMPVADAHDYAFKYVNGHPVNTRTACPR